MQVLSKTDAMQEVLFTEEQLRLRVAQMGGEIRRDYEGLEGSLLVVGLLKGSFIFMSDLVRAIDLSCELEFMVASSYGNGTESSRDVRISRDVTDVEGRHVLLVEDIVDSGYTMNHVMQLLESRHAASVRLASLLDKPSRRMRPVRIDYRGFEIEDKFVVGYGLDFAGQYRNLPYVGVLKPECYQNA